VANPIIQHRGERKLAAEFERVLTKKSVALENFIAIFRAPFGGI
jgi:hypothetical protein